MATLSTNISTTASLFERIKGVLDVIRARHAQYRVYRRTMNELNALSDRDLADLGHSRAGIHAIAWECAYGKNT